MTSQRIPEEFGHTLSLTSERWRHILARHPELAGQRRKIVETLQHPTVVVHDASRPHTHVYHKRFPGMRHWVVVVANLDKGLVVTAYISGRIKRGETIWKRS